MNRPARWGLCALIALGAASGCRTEITHDDSSTRYGGSIWITPEPSPPPSLGLSEEQVRDSLARQRLLASSRHEEALDIVATTKEASTAAVASAVRECYALGDRDAADGLADGKRGVWNWDQASSVAELDCHYRSRGAFQGGCLEVTARRKKGIEGPLAIAFPPGTYGVAEIAAQEGALAEGEHWTNPDDDRRYGHWPSQQDLAFLKAPVVFLGADEDETSFEVPIACASFGSGTPRPDQKYSLRRFEAGSTADRLLLALCAREETSEPEAQLALWLARNDISWDQFCAHGGNSGMLITFGGDRRILPRHAKGAAKLLIEAGADPHAARFFGGHGIPMPAGEGQETIPYAQTCITPGLPIEQELAPAPEPTPDKPADATP